VYKQDGGQRKTGRFTKLFMLLQEFTAIHAQINMGRARASSPTNRQRAFSNSNYSARFPTSTTAQLLQSQTTVAHFSNINYGEHFPNKHL
jgi:hypothetical protein